MNSPTLSDPHPLTDAQKRITAVSNAAYDAAWNSEQGRAIYRAEYTVKIQRHDCGEQAAAQFAWEARRRFAQDAASKAVAPLLRPV